MEPDCKCCGSIQATDSQSHVNVLANAAPARDRQRPSTRSHLCGDFATGDVFQEAEWIFITNDLLHIACMEPKEISMSVDLHSTSTSMRLLPGGCWCTVKVSSTGLQAGLDAGSQSTSTRQSQRSQRGCTDGQGLMREFLMHSDMFHSKSAVRLGCRESVNHFLTLSGLSCSSYQWRR